MVADVTWALPGTGRVKAKPRSEEGEARRGSRNPEKSLFCYTGLSRFYLGVPAGF